MSPCSLARRAGGELIDEPALFDAAVKKAWTSGRAGATVFEYKPSESLSRYTASLRKIRHREAWKSTGPAALAPPPPVALPLPEFSRRVSEPPPRPCPSPTGNPIRLSTAREYRPLCPAPPILCIARCSAVSRRVAAWFGSICSGCRTARTCSSSCCWCCSSDELRCRLRQLNCPTTPPLRKAAWVEDHHSALISLCRWRRSRAAHRGGVSLPLVFGLSASAWSALLDPGLSSWRGCRFMPPATPTRFATVT